MYGRVKTGDKIVGWNATHTKKNDKQGISNLIKKKVSWAEIGKYGQQVCVQKLSTVVATANFQQKECVKKSLLISKQNQK